MNDSELTEATRQGQGRQRCEGPARLLSRPAVVCLLLAVVTLAVYWPARNCEFINYDDPEYVTSNPHVLRGFTLSSVVWAFRTVDSSNWHPVTWVSHLVDVQLFGLNPAGPHVVNVLFHVGNTVLLFVVLRGLTGGLWRSAWVAGLFALHPLHVESVAWVSERKDVLSGFFFLLTLWAYGRYAQKKSESEVRSQKSGGRDEVSSFKFQVSGGETSATTLSASNIQHPTHNSDQSRAGSQLTTRNSPFSSLPDYCLALLFFVLGLMSKSMLVTLPFVLLLLDYWPLKRVSSFKCQVSSGELSATNIQHSTFNAQHPTHNSQLTTHNSQLTTHNFRFALLVEKIPFFLLSGIFCVLTVVAQRAGGAVLSLAHLPLGARIENAFVSCARYLGKVFWPVNLALPYPHPGSWMPALVLFAMVLVAALSVGVLRWRRQWPWVFVGWFWFLGMLIPVIGLVQVGLQSMADRYTYVPSIGLFLALAWGGGAVLARCRVPRLPAAAGAVLILGVCAARTSSQLRYWRNSGSLFGHATEVSAGNYFAHDLLGSYLAGEGQEKEAIDHFREALRINPADPVAAENLGRYYLSRGRLDEAIEVYERLVRNHPARVNAWENLGSAFEKRGLFARAMHCYETARRLEPNVPEPLDHLGNILYGQNRYDEAIQCFQTSLRLAPEDFRVLNNLGSALCARGRFAEAIACFEAALRLKPDFSDARDNLARARRESRAK